MAGSNALQYLAQVYQYTVWFAGFLQAPILFLFRLNWGWQFFQTGRGKLSDIQFVYNFFTDLKIPFPHANAWFVSGLECFGGLLILVGFCSRPIAFLLSASMVVAYIAPEDDRATLLNVFNNPEPFLAATPFFFLLTTLLVLAFGPGAFSVDAILKHYYR